MLEDSQLQIMRLGESNSTHFEGSDLQILGFRTFQGIGGPTICCKTQCVEELLRLCSLGPKTVHFPNNIVPPLTFQFNSE